MTIEEFNNTRFAAGDKIKYDGKTYELVTVDFKEALIGYLLIEDSEDSEDISWARCENCELIPRG